MINSLFFVFCFLVLFSCSKNNNIVITDVPQIVDKAIDDTYSLKEHNNISNLLNIDLLYLSIHTTRNVDGLKFELPLRVELNDGSVVDSKNIYGNIIAGPYPFEKSGFDIKRYRLSSDIDEGECNIPVKGFFADQLNVSGWKEQGYLALKIFLFENKKDADRNLGVYDLYLAFDKVGEGFIKLPTVTEGPFVSFVEKSSGYDMIIYYKTDVDVDTELNVLNYKKYKDQQKTKKHIFTISGLAPGKEYQYRVNIDAVPYLKEYRFHTPPRKGEGDVTFALMGDSRASIDPTNNLLGMNYSAVNNLSKLAYYKGAEFIVFGGDLVNGYTTSVDDLRTQFYGWKQSISSFWHERPVFTVMGNHDTAYKIYEKKSKLATYFDNWPYQTDSSEAVFNDEFLNPQNAPAPMDEDRPSYKGTVYSFQYGLVKVIVYNTNYFVGWKNKDARANAHSGVPEGYILEEQIVWLKNEIAKAEKDKSIKYIVLSGHEALLPNIHVSDAMWYKGNNLIRASIYNKITKKVEPELKGIIDVRNDLIKIITASKKTVMLVNSDDHIYQKMLLDKYTPVGDIHKDDKNANNVVCEDDETCSPLPDDIKYPLWTFINGSAGSPYYAATKRSPWARYWLSSAKNKNQDFFKTSSHENIFIVNANKNKISISVFSVDGELIDRVDDLAKIK